jgi:DNA polymerase-3 subunit gamma/tau
VEPSVKKSDQASPAESEDAVVSIISSPVAPDGANRPLENLPELAVAIEPDPQSVAEIEAEAETETETETEDQPNDDLIVEGVDKARKNNIEVQAPNHNEPREKDISPIVRVSLNEFSPSNWIEVRSHLDIGASLGEIASHCLFTGRDQDALVFVIDNQENSLYDSSHQESLGIALSDYFDHPVNVVISSGVAEQETPRAASMRDTAERHAAAVDRLNSDTAVVQFKQLFDGSLDESSVKPID